MGVTTEEDSSVFSYDVFLSHANGQDSLGRDTRTRVAALADRLRDFELIPWVDEVNMSTGEATSEGIVKSKVFLACVTVPYLVKVNTKNSTDNCHLEFMQAIRYRRSEHMLAVVMDPAAVNTAIWGNRVGSALGRQTCVRATGQDYDVYVANICEELARRLPQDSPTAHKALKALMVLEPHLKGTIMPAMESVGADFTVARPEQHIAGQFGSSWFEI